jgi:hypothetical protein
VVSKHRYGAPLPADELVRLAAYEPHEEGAVREAIDDLRRRSFVLDRGPRGVMLDSSQFGDLADFLYHDCDWPTWEIRTKLKHYEGWSDHDWA